MGVSRTFKIGFSELGGVYIGKVRQSAQHQHYAISIIISFGGRFRIGHPDATETLYEAALVQKNLPYNLETEENDLMAFVHIVPHSDIGIKLTNDQKPITQLSFDLLSDQIKALRGWFRSEENNEEHVKSLLQNLTSVVPVSTKKQVIDKRIRIALKLMDGHNGNWNIHEMAQEVHLSPSHFARLLKLTTGLTFREYILHSKLTRSLHAMYKENSLTEASFIGGFADQPHFSRTFKSAFGIKPSSSRK